MRSILFLVLFSGRVMAQRDTLMHWLEADSILEMHLETKSTNVQVTGMLNLDEVISMSPIFQPDDEDFDDEAPTTTPIIARFTISIPIDLGYNRKRMRSRKRRRIL